MVKWTPRVGPWLSLPPFILTLYKTHFSLRWTLSVGSKGGCLERELTVMSTRKSYEVFTLLYQLFWAQACPEGMCTNWTQVPCKVPSLPNPTTHKGLPHHWGLRPLLFLNSDVGSFTSHKNKSVKVL